MKKVNYITVKEAAEKWGLTPRRVQQLCKEGQITSAQRRGREWLIPEDTEKPEVVEKAKTSAAGSSKPAIQPEPFMPLTASAFPLGQCEDYIRRFPEEEQPLAFAEYYYFSGQAERAAAAAEPYLNHRNLKKKLTACIVYGFASMSLGRIRAARFALGSSKETLLSLRNTRMDEPTKAACVYASTMGCVLLHLPENGVPPLENYLRYLPQGHKLYACYILAHRDYLHQRYERALGMVETALAWCTSLYPISTIYLHVIAAVCAMNAKRMEEAREHFRLAWELAGPDDLIEAVGEHHGLLQGLIESMLKPLDPEAYQRVIQITYSFSGGWRKIHNPDTGRQVADDLTTTEFTIAMLADRGWSYQEIADHMNLSPNTVSKYLSGVYQELGINTKEELHDYMLY